MQKLRGFLVFCFAVASLFGCSKTKVTRAPDGILRLECQKGMRDCVAQAEKYCNVQKKDGGYSILGGRSKKVMMGSKYGQYQKAVESAELEVKCGLDEKEQKSEVKEDAVYRLPPRTDEEVEASDLPAAPLPPTSVCTRGSTQACVGPGACAGGQVCLEDGSGYGPCDCGSSTDQATPPAKDEKTAPAPPLPLPGSQPEPLRQPN